MDDMDFATHDNTPGPPAHANDIPQSSAEWFPHPLGIHQHLPYPPAVSSHYNAANSAFSPDHNTPLQNGPYQAAGLFPPAAPWTSTNMNQYHMAAGSWTPPASIQHQPNTYARSLGPAVGSSSRPNPYAFSGPPIPPAAPQPQLGFPQQVTLTNLQTSMMPWPDTYPLVNQQPAGSVPYFSQPTSYSTHSRHNSQPNQHQQRNVQVRGRPARTHWHTHSASALSPNIVDNRTTATSSFSERRHPEHARVRRSGSARFAVSESRSDSSRQFGGSPPLYPGPQRQPMMNQAHPARDEELRHFRAAVRAPAGVRGTKYVASKAALQSLEEVRFRELPEGDRTCMICYNEYETVSPEGFSETPTRLPNCKHVFGNRCIRKWLQDSDTCPYCRNKLDSEPKRFPSSTRAFLDMMRIRGWTAGSEVAEDFYRRIMAGEDVRAFVSVSRPVAERRPPPDDDDYDDSSRRTRQRRSSSSSAEPEFTSPTQSPASLRQAIQQRATPNSSGQASPTQAGVSSNPWMLMGPAPPGSPGSIVHNVPFRYQSPARPAQSTVVHQPNPAVQPSVTRHRAYARNFGPGVNSRAMPNPLGNNGQSAQMLHVDSADTLINQYADDIYSSGQESS